MKNIEKHLKQLVDIYPYTSDQKSVKKALEYARLIIESTGFFKYVELHNIGGVYNLTAMPHVEKRAKVLLQGHIDVVAKPSKMAYSQNGDIVTGRGVFDMLFATASYLAFLEENVHTLKDLDIGLMLTGDEELGGENGVKALLDEGYYADVCILPDAGSHFGDITIAAKGVYHAELRVNGRAHHGSRPWEGDGAGNKLVALLSELMNKFDHSDRSNSTISVTKLDAWHSSNTAPGSAVAMLDIRFKDQADYVRIVKELQELCEKYKTDLVSLEYGANFELDMQNDYVKEFLVRYEKASEKPLSFSKAHGSSDARFFVEKNIPVIMFRPDGGSAHGDEEYLSMSSFEDFHKLLSDYLLDVAKI